MEKRQERNCFSLLLGLLFGWCFFFVVVKAMGERGKFVGERLTVESCVCRTLRIFGNMQKLTHFAWGERNDELLFLWFVGG